VRREAGDHLDPELVEIFVALPEEIWRKLAPNDLASMTFAQIRDLVRRVAEPSS
jgi:hypothetical protein